MNHSILVPSTVSEVTAGALIRPTAEILAHSIHRGPAGSLADEVVSGQMWIHRFVLSELNTHRSLAKNSASSRAIPIIKQLQMLAEDPAFPVVWPREKSGMQGGEPLDAAAEAEARDQWTALMNAAIKVAEDLRALGLHKSLTNRLLEPWMWHKVVITGSAWENFYRQRCDEQAQPEIRVAAEAMREAHRASTPVELRLGEWHTPYVYDADRDMVYSAQGRALIEQRSEHLGYEIDEQRLLAQISAARSARTSSLTNPVVDQDGNVVNPARVDISKDLRLYDALVAAEPRHWSPLEHPCTPWPENKQTAGNGMPALTFTAPGGAQATVATGHLPRIGSVYGYRTLRTEVETLLGEVTFR